MGCFPALLPTYPLCCIAAPQTLFSMKTLNNFKSNYSVNWKLLSANFTSIILKLPLSGLMLYVEFVSSTMHNATVLRNARRRLSRRLNFKLTIVCNGDGKPCILERLGYFCMQNFAIFSTAWMSLRLLQNSVGIWGFLQFCCTSYLENANQRPWTLKSKVSQFILCQAD